jgi:putative transposase
MQLVKQRRIDLHVASRPLAEYLVQRRIGALVIGKNDGWKHGVRLGKRTNQALVFLPYARFSAMLTYQAELDGIQVALTEESYASKRSFFEDEPPSIGSHTSGSV